MASKELKQKINLGMFIISVIFIVIFGYKMFFNGDYSNKNIFSLALMAFIMYQCKKRDDQFKK